MRTPTALPLPCRRLRAVALLATALATTPLAAADQRWQRFGPPATSLFVTALDPSRPDTLLAATVSGDLYASDDAGRSWSWSATGLPRSAEVSALAADAGLPGRIFAAGPRRIYRSDDHGRRWQPVSDPAFAPFPPAGPVPYRCLLTVVPGTSPPVLLFAGLGLGPIWRSMDGGVHWSALPDVGPTWYLVPTLEGAVYAGNGIHFWRSDAGGQGFAEVFAFGGPEVIYAPAATGDVVYVADGRLIYRSDDRGGNFRLVHAAEDFVGIGQLLVDPDDADRVWGARYLSGPFGVQPSIVVSTDGGTSWQVTGSGLVHGTVAQLLLARQPGRGRPGRVVAQGDSELGVSDDGGLTWSTRVVTGLRHLAVFAANHVRFDRRRPDTVQALVGGRAFASDDAGRRWQPMADRATDGGFGLLYDLADDPVRPGFLWQGGGQGLGTSRDGGVSWDPLVGVDVGDVLALAFPRRNSLLAAGWGLTWSADRGRHWTTAELRGDAAPQRLFDDLVADPTLPRVVVAHGLITDLRNGQLIVLGRDSWRSADGGRKFGRLPVEPVAFGADGTAYGALTGGNVNGGSQLAVSRDHGATWQPVGAPIDGMFRALAVDPRAQSQILALVERPVDRQVLRSPDGGLTWQTASGGLSAYELLLCQRLVADPTTPHRFILSGDQGLFAATWAP